MQFGIFIVFLLRDNGRVIVSWEAVSGTEIPGGGGEAELYLALHCHHQNDSCIKMGSDDGHFNVSFIVRGKVTRQCPQKTTFEEREEPKRIRTEILLSTYEPKTPYRLAKSAH